MPEINEMDWRGLDLSQEADNIPPGAVQVADNLVLDGIDLITRPGLTAVLTSAQSSGIFAYTPIVSAMGSETAIYAADSVLRYWSGGATASTVSGTGTVAHASAQIATIPDAAFLVDNAMALTRVAFTAGAPTGAAAVTELDRPAAPTASITTMSTRGVKVAAETWTTSKVDGTTAAPGTSGAGGTIAPMSSITPVDMNLWDGGHTTGTDFWAIAGGATCSPNILTANRDNCVELDNKGESATTDPITLNAMASPDSGYAKLAVVEYQAAAEDSGAPSTPTEVVDLTVSSYDVTPTLIAANTYRSPLLAQDTPRTVRVLWDGRALSTVPRSLVLKFEQPYDRPGNLGTDVNHVNVYVPQQQLEVLKDTDNKLTVRQGTVQVWNGLGSQAQGNADAPVSSAPSTFPTGRLLTQGLFVRSTLSGSALNLSTVRTIAAEVLPGAGVSGLQVRIHFKQTNWYQTNTLDIPNGGGWATVDISTLQQVGSSTTITPASLTAVTDVRFEIVSDVLIESLQEQGTSTVVRFGDIREAGNLLSGRDYWYALVEVNSNSDATLVNVIHSDGSVPTNAIRPTDGERMARIVLPARTTASSDYLALYRFGGAFLPELGSPELPTGRLLCWIAWSTATFSAMGDDTQKPTSPASGYPIVFANPFIHWTKTGSTGDAGSILIDNTPDSWLSGADTYLSGREKAPTAPTAIAEWDSRLWLGKDADLYASWLIEPGRNAGIYWTRIAEPTVTDPEVRKKGWWVRLQLRPGDGIKRIIPVGGGNAPYVIVLTRYSAFIVSRGGSGNADDLYSVRELRGDDVGGVVGIYAACTFDEAVYWLSDRGLLRWQPGQVDVSIVGDKVRRLLPGVSPSLTYHATALAKCALMPHPHFLYVSVPDGAADTTPDSTIVWHQREKGWTRWLKGFSGGSGDILAGHDGQLWRVGGSGDKATPASGAAAVAVSMTTRKMNDGLMVFNPARLFYSVNLPGAVNGTLTFTLQGDGSTNGSVTQTVLGDVSNRVRLSRSGAGRRHEITMSASTIERLRVRAIGIDLVPATRRRV